MITSPSSSRSARPDATAAARSFGVAPSTASSSYGVSNSLAAFRKAKLVEPTPTASFVPARSTSAAVAVVAAPVAAAFAAVLAPPSSSSEDPQPAAVSSASTARPAASPRTEGLVFFIAVPCLSLSGESSG